MFSQIALVTARLGKGKTLKIHVKINPLFYEDSLRLRVYKIEGKIFLKLASHFVKESAPARRENIQP